MYIKAQNRYNASPCWRRPFFIRTRTFFSTIVLFVGMHVSTAKSELNTWILTEKQKEGGSLCAIMKRLSTSLVWGSYVSKAMP